MFGPAQATFPLMLIQYIYVLLIIDSVDVVGRMITRDLDATTNNNNQRAADAGKLTCSASPPLLMMYYSSQKAIFYSQPQRYFKPQGNSFCSTRYKPIFSILSIASGYPRSHGQNLTYKRS